MKGSPMTAIRYDPNGVFLERGGITREQLAELRPRLAAARDEVLLDADLWAGGGDVPPAKQPLDAGFHFLPDRLLDELRDKKEGSLVARIRASADRLGGSLDSVVVLGIGGSYMGARALLEACCHPYYNEVSRGERGGRPRMYFEGNNVDNDAVADLLALLKSRGDRWGIVVISKSGGTLETAAAFRIFLRALTESREANSKRLDDLVVPITGSGSKLFALARAIGSRDVFPVPDGVGGRFSVLSAVGLLPAAILGLDIEQLLAGAAAMNEHFCCASSEENVILNYVGVCHLMETKRGCNTRILSTWGKRLEAFGFWYDQLLAESLGKKEHGALPLTAVNTRDLHSRGQQHQEGPRDKLISNVVVESTRHEPIAVGRSELDQDKLNVLAERTLPDILRAALAGTNQAYRDDSRPTADIRVPELNEHVVGQLFQMMMLATVLEGRLIGINPYGQPGVEAYKKNMDAILKG
jgi:glucose-6-phosphate isomerase